MTNEEVLRVFLKQNRMYALYKKNILRETSEYYKGISQVQNAIVYAFNWSNCSRTMDWLRLSNDWNQLVVHFKLTGTINKGIV